MDFFAKGTKGNQLHTQIEGPEPGYAATPIFVIQSAIVLLEGVKATVSSVTTVQLGS